MAKRIDKLALFLKLAQPDETGVSRWVAKTEFVGEFQPLYFDNGFPWGRKGSTLDKRYIVKKDTTLTPGNTIDRIKLDGYNPEDVFQQHIRPDIKEQICQRKCVMLGFAGTSTNTEIQVDHKDGRKSDMRVSDLSTQRVEDFQPLCRAANTMKRQACKECKRTGIRWDAKNLEGNPVSYYKGEAVYTPEIGCVGCYLYDPVAYRKAVYAVRA